MRVTVLALAAVLAGAAPAWAAGTLAPPQTYALTGGGVSDVAAGDVTGDGRLDVLAAQPGPGVVDVLAQQAPSSAEARPTFVRQRLVEGGNRAAAAAGDWDGDGDTDYVTVAGSTLQTYLNDGAGTFSTDPMRDRAVRGGVAEILTRDLNGDGRLDLLLGSAPWSVLPGGPGGVWGTRTDYEIPFGRNNVTGLAVGDVNGDALPDVATSLFDVSPNQPGVRLWIGTQDGGFTAGPELPAGENASHKSVGIGDLNGDADPEVVYGTNDSLHVWIGGAGDSFGGRTSYAAPGAGALAMGDLDRDGVQDVVGGWQGSGVVRVYRGTGTGGLHAGQSFPLGESAQTVQEVKLADFDGDGGLDVYTANNNTTTSILFNEVAANLDVTLSDTPDPVAGGQTVTYTARVENSGPDAASGATLTLGPPAGVPVESAPAGCAASGAAYTCALGTVADGAVVTRQFVVRPASAGAIAATASVAAAERDPVGADDDDTEQTTVTSSESPAALELRVLQEPATTAVGETLSFTATIENHGAGAARDVVLTDDLPAGTSFVSALADSGGTCTTLARRVRCSFGVLAPGASAGAVIRVIATQAGTLTNLLEVTTSSPEVGAHPNSVTTERTVTAGGGGGAAPVVSVGDAEVDEGDVGNVDAAFTVLLSAPAASPVSVGWATRDGSAVDPADFGGRSGTAVIPAGATQTTILVPVRGDGLDEADETFDVTLSAPVGATLGDATGTASITDDDAPPALTVVDVTVDEGETGERPATFTLRLSRESGRTVRAGWATADGTATAGSDYTARTSSTPVTFAPGVTEQTVEVPVLGDFAHEPAETFSLALADVEHATVGPPATATIRNDDSVDGVISAPDTFGFEPFGSLAGEARVQLTADRPARVRTRLRAVTVPGTADAADYVAFDQEITLEPGERSATIVVEIRRDSVLDGGEHFFVDLSRLEGDLSLARTRVRVGMPGFDLGSTDGYQAPGPSGATIGTIRNVSVDEGGTATPTLSVAAAVPSGVKARVHVAPETNAAQPQSPDDFDGGATEVTLPKGGLTLALPVRTHDDKVDEDGERVSVRVEPVDGGWAAATGTVTIGDNDDQRPTVEALGTMRFRSQGHFAVRLSRESEARRTVRLDHGGDSTSGSGGSWLGDSFALFDQVINGSTTESTLRKTVSITSCSRNDNPFAPGSQSVDPCSFSSDGFEFTPGAWDPLSHPDKVLTVLNALNNGVARIDRQEGGPGLVTFEPGEMSKVVPMTFREPLSAESRPKVHVRVDGGCSGWTGRCITVPVEQPAAAPAAGGGGRALAEVGGGIDAPVQCPPGKAGCSGALELQTTRGKKAVASAVTRLGRVAFRLRPGERRRLRVPLNRRARTLLRRSGRLDAILVARVRVGKGPLQTQRRPVVLRKGSRRPKSRKG